ncbi:MAG: PfkB family carbohydrate kinase [Acidobacteriota bacterium]|nr:PfkB family carbohydrate kinase [Acidobacteriota bacterium]MDH3530689.1 PfkB family carbohydrate kinase [Acidobacteriota bacterium]
MDGVVDIIRNQFPEKKILVVGDMVADQFLRGSISRVSREAPVFILRHENTETLGGGAANAASNVAALDGQAFLVGVAGNDANGRALTKTLSANGVNLKGVVISDSFETTTKLRVLAGQQYARRQQVIRIDYENTVPIDEESVEALGTKSLMMMENVDAVIVSDYGYGVVTEELFLKIKRRADQSGIPVIVDSRSRLDQFSGATAATPNKEEVEQLLKAAYSPEACKVLRERLGLEALLVTLGNKGMFLTVEKGNSEIIPIVGKDEPVDVTGAGDTVIATFALGVASKAGFLTSARIANHAGGAVVMKKGTATLTAEELIESISKYEPELAAASLQQAT